MKAPGERAWIYYDSTARVREGDYLRTPTGRTYLIETVRIQQRGKHAGRQHLMTIVMPDDHETEPDAHVFPVEWYARNKTGNR